MNKSSEITKVVLTHDEAKSFHAAIKEWAFIQKDIHDQARVKSVLEEVKEYANGLCNNRFFRFTVTDRENPSLTMEVSGKSKEETLFNFREMVEAQKTKDDEGGTLQRTKTLEIPNWKFPVIERQ